MFLGREYAIGYNVIKPYNRNIIKVLRLSRDMMLLADRGDEYRQDISCGVLYGTLRDSAYKLRSLAEQEIDIHKSTGLWDVDEGGTSEGPSPGVKNVRKPHDSKLHS
jgi:hypothetical protein